MTVIPLPMILRILLLSLALTSFNACFKTKDTEPKPDLPPLTTEGKNTFGCYINGVAQVFGSTFLNTGGPLLEARWHKNHVQGDSLLYLWARKIYATYPPDPDLIIHSESIGIPIIAKDTGFTTILNIYDNAFAKHFVNYQIFPDCLYKIDTSKAHSVRLVSFDLQAQIASGTFEMTLFNSTTCNDTLVITDGRFDVRFTPQ